MATIYWACFVRQNKGRNKFSIENIYILKLQRKYIDQNENQINKQRNSLCQTTRTLKQWTKFVCMFLCAGFCFNCLSSELSCMFWGQYACNHIHCCSTMGILTKAVANTTHTHTSTLKTLEHTACDALCAENNMEHKMQMWFYVCKSNNLFCILAINVFLVLKLRYPSSAPDICLNRKNVNFQCKHTYTHSVYTIHAQCSWFYWKMAKNFVCVCVLFHFKIVNAYNDFVFFPLPRSDCTLQTFR